MGCIRPPLGGEGHRGNRLRVTSSITVITFLLSCGQAFAQQAGQAAGLAVARRVCSECHHVERKGGASPYGDAPSFRTIANARGMTADILDLEIRREHEMMPNVILNGRELRDVIAYILSLRRVK